MLTDGFSVVDSIAACICDLNSTQFHIFGVSAYQPCIHECPCVYGARRGEFPGDTMPFALFDVYPLQISFTPTSTWLDPVPRTSLHSNQVSVSASARALILSDLACYSQSFCIITSVLFLRHLSDVPLSLALPAQCFRWVFLLRSPYVFVCYVVFFSHML